MRLTLHTLSFWRLASRRRVTPRVTAKVVHERLGWGSRGVPLVGADSALGGSFFWEPVGLPCLEKKKKSLWASDYRAPSLQGTARLRLGKISREKKNSQACCAAARCTRSTVEWACWYYTKTTTKQHWFHGARCFVTVVPFLNVNLTALR